MKTQHIAERNIIGYFFKLVVLSQILCCAFSSHYLIDSSYQFYGSCNQNYIYFSVKSVMHRDIF